MLSNISELINVVEGILFVSGQGVEIKDIAEKLEVDTKKIQKVIEELKQKHINDGINVITYKSSVQMCSNPTYAEDIATVLNPIREKQLTKAALETLAIIAYKQPLTRLDIEQVRGVNSDYALQVLINFKLIEVVGRKDAVGKPLLFGTTDEFLKRFDLQDINDLPDYDDLLNRIKILHEPTTDSLYKSTEIIPEEDLPDSKKKLEEQAEQEAQNNEKIKNEPVDKNVEKENSDIKIKIDNQTFDDKNGGFSLNKENFDSKENSILSSDYDNIENKNINLENVERKGTNFDNENSNVKEQSNELSQADNESFVNKNQLNLVRAEDKDDSQNRFDDEQTIINTLSNEDEDFDNFYDKDSDLL